MMTTSSSSAGEAAQPQAPASTATLANASSRTYRVLLIYPFHTSQDSSNRWYPQEPLGLLYLGSYLKREAEKAQRSIETRILDAHMAGPDQCTKTEQGNRSGMTDEQIRNYVEEFRPDVVGITNNYTFGLQDVLDIARLVRVVCPKAVIVVGGAHSTIADKDVAKNPDIDIVVRGEGEVTFTELVFALQQGMALDGIKGLTYRSGDEIRVNDMRPPIKNLDDLPIPDRTLLDFDQYLKRPGYWYTFNRPACTINTSRGCPYRCIFCSTQKVWTNNWRSRTAGNILQEIEHLISRYGIREIAFQEDQLLGDPARMIEFCKLVVERKLNLSFIAPQGSSPIKMTEELLDWMAKAGFYRLSFSVDVGTDKVVKYVRKPIKLEKIRPLVKYANSRGIWTYGTFVIGFPNELREDILETIRYAYGLKLDFLRFYIAQPHPGSDLYDLYEKEGKLEGVAMHKQHSIVDAFFGTDHLSANELIALRNKAEGDYNRHHLKFFLSPSYVINEFLPKISSFKKFRYFLGLVVQANRLIVRFTKKDKTKADTTPAT